MTRHSREADPERLAALIKGIHLVEPPPGTIHKALALRSLLPAPGSGPLEWLATLLFDSLAAPLPAGVRGAALAERRLLYRLDAGDEVRQLDLLVRGKAGRLEVAGQVLPPLPGATVAVRSGRSIRRQALGEAGDFLLRGIPLARAGVTLALEVDGRPAVEIAGIALSAGSA